MGELFTQSTCGFEFHNLASGYLDFFFCAGVQAYTSSFLYNRECTEAEKGNLIFFNKGL